VLFILTALVLMGLPSRAAAQACSFSVSNINFGSVSPVAVGTTVDATGTLSVDCSNLGLLHLTPVTIGVCPNLDAGSGGSNSSGRLMSGTGGTIPYQIYQDAGRTTPWGAAAFLFFNSVPTVILTSDSSGAIHATRTLYARVTNQRSSPSGSYSSTFTGQTFYWGLTIASCGVATVGTIGTPQPFTVSVSVPVDCLLTTGALDFGSKGLLTTTVAAQAAITVACTSDNLWPIQGRGTYPALGRRCSRRWDPGIKHRHWLQSVDNCLWRRASANHTGSRRLFRLRRYHADILIGREVPYRHFTFRGGVQAMRLGSGRKLINS
jgi:spore coat protein U-like protein